MTRINLRFSNAKPRHIARTIVAISSLILVGCQSDTTPLLDKDTVNLCRSKAIELGSSQEEINRLHRECILKAREGKANNPKSANSGASPASDPILGDSVESYTYCVFNRDKISKAYNSYIALSGRVPVFERQFGASSGATQNAIQEARQAEMRLGDLIPQSMRDGLPLIPDAALKFSNCNRRDFGIEE